MNGPVQAKLLSHRLIGFNLTIASKIQLCFWAALLN
ncbi:Uncharacterised protein [Vibrio cholerae]|nr:Uncharacterised protein [Vibrio cholerae]